MLSISIQTYYVSNEIKHLKNLMTKRSNTQIQDSNKTHKEKKKKKEEALA
jgi:hypothetical protein